jgi:hypothetical protein
MSKLMPIVEVEWIDSNGLGHWQDKDYMSKWAKDESLLCRSAGYLYEKTKDRIVLVQSESPASLGAGLAIPRKAIIKLVELHRDDA